MVLEGLQGAEEGGAMRYLFGNYVLDIQRYELHGAGVPIKLRRKVFQVLAYLLVHRDRWSPSTNSSHTCGRTSLSGRRH